MAYGILEYGDMLADPVRVGPILDRLRTLITPSTVFLDLGAGPGVFALCACQLGAARVYAIDINPHVHGCQVLARANGLGDRLVVIQGDSRHITLPERANVFFADLRGVLPFAETNIPACVDARERHLTADCDFIFQEDELWVSAVQFSEAHDSLAGPWESTDLRLDFDYARDLAMNSWRRSDRIPDAMLSPQLLGTIDYRTVQSADFLGEATWTAPQAQMIHGLLVWFNARLSGGGVISNSPLDPPHRIYGRGFFPFRKPLSAEPGDHVTARFEARLMADGYQYRWEGTLRAGDVVKGESKQTTYFSQPRTARHFAARDSAFQPRLSTRAKVDLEVLQMMEQQLSLGEIAIRLVRLFPGRFKNEDEALIRVGHLSSHYSLGPGEADLS